MSEKRRDHRGRILHNGEIQLSDGRYRFKYVDEMGKERCVYSWRLDHNDATPKGKRRTLSLREMEKKIQADHFEQIATNGGNMTVLELVEKYTSTKTGVRPTTVAGYGTVINLLKKDPFGKRRIDTVRISDAKCWLIHLQQVEKKSYSSIHSIRGVLRPAFQLAVDDDLIRKNPFQFQLMEVVVNDSVTREAISRAEERKNEKAPEKDTPETSENQGGSTPVSHSSDATSVSSSPKTGDNTNIAIFVLALAVSAGCLGTVVTVKRKRK